jgi:hypothetical protein
MTMDFPSQTFQKDGKRFKRTSKTLCVLSRHGSGYVYMYVSKNACLDGIYTWGVLTITANLILNLPQPLPLSFRCGNFTHPSSRPSRETVYAVGVFSSSSRAAFGYLAILLPLANFRLLLVYTLV